MATSALTPTQPKQERMKPLGMFEDTVEYIYGSLTGAGAGSTQESPVISQEMLDKDRGWSEIKPAQGTPIGGKTEIQFNDPAKIELRHTRIFFRDLAEAQAHAQKVAHSPSLNDEDLEVQIEAMPEEVWNGKLHLSLDFDKKHTLGKPYYMTEYRRVHKEDVNKFEKAQNQQTETEIQAPVAFEMGENEMFKGTESKSHFTQVAS